MPSSAPVFTTEICQLVITNQPKTILDIGIGFGHYGCLFRNYSDIFQGRYDCETWETEIVGVEAFPKYIHDGHRYFYNEIITKPIEDVVELLPSFDFVFCGDMLEHLPKAKGLWLLEELKKISKILVLQVPLGMDWDQGEVLGNPFEEHKAVWLARDFNEWNLNVRKFRGKEIGLAYVAK